jgi:hypothetical protein
MAGLVPAIHAFAALRPLIVIPDAVQRAAVRRRSGIVIGRSRAVPDIRFREFRDDE